MKFKSRQKTDFFSCILKLQTFPTDVICLSCKILNHVHTLDSGIEVGHGKFGKNLRVFLMKKTKKKTIIFPIFDTY